MVAPFSKFTAKFGLVFALTLENAFSQRFHFQANRKSIGSSKKRYQGFSKQPSVGEISMVLCQNFEHFQYFNFEADLQKKTNLFSKNCTEYRVLVERTKIEKASFSYKTAISEANVNYKMITTKQAYSENGVLPVTTLYF